MPQEPEDKTPRGCTPSERVKLGDARWRCEQNGVLITGWQLVSITGIPSTHFTAPGTDVRRVSKGDEPNGISYVRVR